MRKIRKPTFGTILVFLISLSTGVFFLSWGVWLYLYGHGTRPAGFEFFFTVFGVFLSLMAIIIIFGEHGSPSD